MKPTEKQTNFIAEICEILECEVPTFEDAGEASKWISSHLDSYKRELWLLRHAPSTDVEDLGEDAIIENAWDIFPD